MKIKSLFYYTFSLFVAMFFVSCETDFSEAGASLPDSDEFSFERYTVNSIKTSLKEAKQVNVRDLPINSLGGYSQSIFGSKKIHLVTQLKMDEKTSFGSIGGNPKLDSVYVYLPFNAKAAGVDEVGGTEYLVNGVYGNGTFDLKVYENKYLIKTVNPNDAFENQFYYSDQKLIFDQNKSSQILNTSNNTAQNTAFHYNTDEILLYKYHADGSLKKDKNGNPEVKERKAPGLWLDLDKNYFQSKFFDSGAYKNLINNSVLSDFFRGLYFEVSNIQGNALAQFDLTKAELVFVYKQDKASNPEEKERKTLTLHMGDAESYKSTSVNLIEENTSSDFRDVIANTNNTSLWLKGGNATYCIIDLFNGDAKNDAELQELKDEKWLINQAVLTITLDRDILKDELDFSPYRLFLYDFKNNKPIIDYQLDATTRPVKNVYGGFLNEQKTKYQFRVTDYVRNLLQKDSTNVQLGLVVANDISKDLFNKIKGNDKVKIPETSTMFPFGTVVYGAQHPDINKRMKLDIFYTKIKE